ncbi:MAG TPA: hypothetical protein VG326_02100 [Tepidisphaeraceae bacterium]|jgi:glycosyltransferase involved in cell wall biosynthesis|nr:hypothetical protein [Tepidisphaeraceae bacterium]
MRTVVHVTHEAIEKIGGISAVLQGLLTSAVYIAGSGRNILVGPYWNNDAVGELRLGHDGEVLYSSLDSLDRSPLAAAFSEIERKFDVGIIYGRRRYVDKSTGIVSSPEVVLIDVSRYDAAALGSFKYDLWKTFGIDSARYEKTWDYDQWVRLAEPAIACLHALGATSQIEPCVILSHEYMGMPTILAAILQADRANFRTIFYAHEVATMRRIVENAPGQDTMFYNVMNEAVAAGRYVQDVFGDQSDFYKHALIETARHCDGIFAVGDYTLREIHFLGPAFADVDVQLAYNGVPCFKISPGDKANSRRKLRQYAKALLKFEPDFIFTHVTRLVPSKGLWRDLRVLEHMESRLRARNETAVLFTLSTEAPARGGDDVYRMEQWYHWPVVHREGHPDLSAGEAVYYQGVQEFNAQNRNLKVVFVNQFGWEQKRCGVRMSIDMEFLDIRKGSDVEFGQSIYEPFGIAQIEPISFGGICVFSSVCGCAGFVERAAGGTTPNAIVADYTDIRGLGLRPGELLDIGQSERDRVEDHVAQRVADALINRLARTPAEFERAIDRGYALASKMNWDTVATQFIIPGIQRACKLSHATAPVIRTLG